MCDYHSNIQLFQSDKGTLRESGGHLGQSQLCPTQTATNTGEGGPARPARGSMNGERCLAVLTLVAYACTSVHHAGVMPQVEFKVTGMSCGGCSGSVEKVVSQIAGVTSVKAEHSPTDKVTVDGSFDSGAVKDAITKAGFSVVE